VVHGQEVNLVLSNPIDDTVAADDDLAKVLDPQFGNNPSRAWIICQSIGNAEDSVGECRRLLRGVSSNEQAGRLEIIGCLRRPPYLSHFSIRFRTSA
jgi:hypothetical protein